MGMVFWKEFGAGNRISHQIRVARLRLANPFCFRI
jgi:hypothetical protein